MQKQSDSTAITFQVHHSLDEFDAQQWQTLAHGAGPFLQYSWLNAFEQTTCVGGKSGWQPAHWSAWRDGHLLAVAPGYVKTHSYGEYVFDHSWANAYHQHGMDYYPKWIGAIPFTPVTGPRLLASPAVSSELIAALGEAINHWAADMQYSSCHWLFSLPSQAQAFENAGYSTRYSVQFQWLNRGYDNFDDFLSRMTSRKRKSIRKTRQRFVEHNVHIEQLSGDALSKEVIQFFVHCYQDTYYKRSGHAGYLTPAFFEHLYNTFRDHILIVKASHEGVDIAAALFLYDETGLYGRYWGCLQDLDELHFECCYFQGIDFAIKHNLPLFNPGTQGEHKILRGFEPLYCVSHHKMHDLRFHQAVADFLHQEKPIIEDYFQQAQNVLPFNEAYKNEFVIPKQTGVKTNN